MPAREPSDADLLGWWAGGLDPVLSGLVGASLVDPAVAARLTELVARLVPDLDAAPEWRVPPAGIRPWGAAVEVATLGEAGRKRVVLPDVEAWVVVLLSLDDDYEVVLPVAEDEAARVADLPRGPDGPWLDLAAGPVDARFVVALLPIDAGPDWRAAEGERWRRAKDAMEAGRAPAVVVDVPARRDR